MYECHYPSFINPLRAVLLAVSLSTVVACGGSSSSGGPGSRASTPDVAAPGISDLRPEPGDTCTAINNVVVSVTFSEDMNANSVNSSSFSVRDTSGNPVAGTLAYANRIATFRPLGTLLNSHPYTVTLSSAITDSAGNAFGGYVWTFTTISQTTAGGYYRACWQAVNDPRVSGYYLYWSSTTPIDIGAAAGRDVGTPTTVELLQGNIGTTGATVYMAVRAYSSADPSINSPLSNEITVVVGQ